MLCSRCFSPSMFVFCALLLCGTALASSQDPFEPGRVIDGRAILDMGWGDNMCALTFDDGPGPHTARLLDLLRERGIPATFFVVGKQLKMRPGLIRRMLGEGHEVENHTLSHGSLRHMPEERQKEEIGSVHAALRELGGEPRFIRPPYGRYDATTVEIAREEGAGLMFWSIDSMDWMHGASIENMRTLTSGQKLRGIFLFHDTHSKTVEAMPEILDRLVADGCRFVTVAEYLRESSGQVAATDEDGKSPETVSSVPSSVPGAFSPNAGKVSNQGTPDVPAPRDALREYRHPLEKIIQRLSDMLFAPSPARADAETSEPVVIGFSQRVMRSVAASLS